MWNPVAGLYTRYGDVRELLAAPDDRFVIMGSGDESGCASIPAACPRSRPVGSATSCCWWTDGRRTPTPTPRSRETVEPLPFHGMGRYPYPAAEHFPDDAAHRAWRKEYNVRRPVKFIEPLVAKE